MFATADPKATVRGAAVVVVAIQELARRAGAASAHVADRAGAAVVAWGAVRHKLAAQFGVTTVCSARISVAAGHWGAAAATARGTGLGHCARVAIVAGRGAGGVRTISCDIAGIDRARLAVVAVHGRAAAAGPFAAKVADRARQAIVTGGLVLRENTAGLWRAAIVGAGVAVGAGRGLAGRAGAVETLFADGAGIAIVATTGAGLVLAAALGLTNIDGTSVLVVAGGCGARQAKAAAAVVAHGAVAAVLAGGGGG